MPPRVTITCTEGVTKDLENVDIQSAGGRPGGEILRRRRSESSLMSAAQRNAGVSSLLPLRHVG